MRDYTTSLTQIKVKEHERLYNITHTNQSKGTRETIQQYTWTQIKVKEQLVVRNDMDVNEHERLSNITLRHTLK